MTNVQTYVVLLRGINVGGHHKVPMTVLRTEMERLGFKKIKPILNSGNIIFTGPPKEESRLEADIALHLEKVFGFDIPVRMLMRRGVPLRTKNFAIGSRMEHRQEIINLAQWGHEKLPGLKAAEYRLTSPADGNHPVFSFCMCPGGMVVPAAAYPETNIINGMSYYRRNGPFANAACVAGVHPDELAGKTVSPLEALEIVENLETAFYRHTGNYRAPACSIAGFLKNQN